MNGYEDMFWRERSTVVRENKVYLFRIKTSSYIPR